MSRQSSRAIGHMYLGDAPGVVEWLRQAADGFPCVVWYERDPWLDPLRKDRAFVALSADLAARRDAARTRLLGR